MKIKIAGPLIMPILIAGILFVYEDSAAQRISWTGNLQYATGSYIFEDATNTFYFVNGLSVSHGRFSGNISIPYIIQDSPWISYSGTSGMIPTGGPQSGSVREGKKGNGMGDNSGRGVADRRRISLPDTSSYTQTGFGDPWVSLSFNVLSPWSITSMRIHTGLKLSVADPVNGFGTGATDASLGASVSQRLHKTFLFGEIHYWWIGDMEDLELNNSLSYGIGIGQSFTPGKWLLTGSVQGSTPIIDDFDPPMYLNLGAGYLYSGNMTFNGLITFGLSESSSDFSIGIGWDIKL